MTKHVGKIVALLVVATLTAMAEYQVFSFRSSLKLPEPQIKRVQGSPERVSHTKSVSLKGYLVTVCCYPCGADFGKGYPSRFYLIRSNDPSKTVHRFSARVTGGVYGISAGTLLPENVLLEDWYNQMAVKKAAAPAKQAWVEIYTESKISNDILIKQLNSYKVFPNGVFGLGVELGRLTMCGMGTTAWRYDQELFPNPRFIIYVKSISGTCTGMARIQESSFDPSNYSIYDMVCISGTFNMNFNQKMTKEIKGNADWDVIDSIIYKHLSFKESLEEEDVPEYQWEEPEIIKERTPEEEIPEE